MLRLDPDLGIVGAAAQRERLLAWLAQTDPATTDGDAPPLAELDLSAVDSFDSAGVQLLLATRHSLALRGQVLRCRGAAEPVRAALTVFGLGGLLSDDGSTVATRPSTPAAGADA